MLCEIFHDISVSSTTVKQTQIVFFMNLYGPAQRDVCLSTGLDRKSIAGSARIAALLHVYTEG